VRGRGRLLESYNGREGVFGRLWEGEEEVGYWKVIMGGRGCLEDCGKGVRHVV